MPSARQEAKIHEWIWRLLEPLLPKYVPSKKGGRPRVANEDCLRGILFVLRSGCRWNDLDRLTEMPSSASCWRRYSDWCQKGLWEKLADKCRQDYDDEIGFDLQELFADTMFAEARKGGSASEKPRLARG